MSDQATEHAAEDNSDTTGGHDSGGNGGLGDLPVWNLDDLYPGVASPRLQQDLDESDARAKDLRDRFEGKLAGIEGADLAAAIADYETLEEVLSKVMSYAQLVYSGNMADPEIGKFYQSCQERVTGISTALVFFVLELNQTAAKGFGKTADEIIGKCIYDLMPPHIAEARKARADAVSI